MSDTQATRLQIVLYEGTGAHPMAVPDRLALMTVLLEQGFGVAWLGPNGGSLPATDGAALLVLGRFDGAVVSLVQENAGRVRVAALPSTEPSTVLGVVESVRAELEMESPGAWLPWFPVIDYDRCTQCMQCLSFCLFGVYGVSAEQKIQVQHSDQCKTNCPACSRVCPEAAIIFPKYKAGPINGEPVSDLDLQREKVKVDISALLGGDVYALLRERSDRAKSRFSKERDADKALQERQKCLVRLREAMDIPPEVLMSLPSLEEIQRRAAEAKARAAAAEKPPAHG